MALRDSVERPKLLRRKNVSKLLHCPKQSELVTKLQAMIEKFIHESTAAWCHFWLGTPLDF
jgi:hypothetical protein